MLDRCVVVSAIAWLIAPTAHAQRWWERPERPPETARPEAPRDAEAGSPEEVVVERPDYQWRWHQVLANPRVGSNMTSVAVDPENADRIFVGTEAYTVLRSFDGGITWDEIGLSPFNFTARRVADRPPGLPRLGDIVPTAFNIYVDPPYRESPANRITLTNVGYDTFFNFATRSSVGNLRVVRSGRGRDARPAIDDRARGVITTGAANDDGALGNIRPLITVTSSLVPESLLDNATRAQTVYPVKRVLVCPGARYPLLAATINEVLGSEDDGNIWVRLFGSSGGVEVNGVACDPADPSRLVVATSFGPYLSFDGGLTFDQDLSAWPGRNATQARFIARDAEPSRLYVAVGSDLFAGDPTSAEGLSWIYPDFDDSSTAPWETIRWIAGDAMQVWLGTDDGVRRSRDGGITWETPARMLFDREKVSQVVAGTNEIGGDRIAVLVVDCVPRAGRTPDCRRTLSYASDDRGERWFPFFDGATRRNIEQIATAPSPAGAPPRWWMVTGGELWATSSPRPAVVGADPRARAWASERLASNPTLDDTVDAALENLHLTEDEIASLVARQHARFWIPEIHFRIEIPLLTQTDRGERMLFMPSSYDQSHVRDRIEGYVFAQWWFPGLSAENSDLASSSARAQLYELRRNVSFAIEDAWNERLLQLRRLQRGMRDPLQIEVLRERVVCLEALIESWLGRPLREPLD